jgi:hypothetical protein
LRTCVASVRSVWIEENNPILPLGRGSEASAGPTAGLGAPLPLPSCRGLLGASPCVRESIVGHGMVCSPATPRIVCGLTM